MGAIYLSYSEQRPSLHIKKRTPRVEKPSFRVGKISLHANMNLFCASIFRHHALNFSFHALSFGPDTISYPFMQINPLNKPKNEISKKNITNSWLFHIKAILLHMSPVGENLTNKSENVFFNLILVSK